MYMSNICICGRSQTLLVKAVQIHVTAPEIKPVTLYTVGKTLQLATNTGNILWILT